MKYILLPLFLLLFIHSGYTQSPDTLHQIVCDSFEHNMGTVEPRVMKLTKKLRYIGKEPGIITRAWTGDPHYICEWPKDLLLPGQEYSITICFHFVGRKGAFHKRMGLILGGGENVEFVFKGRVEEEKK